MEEQTVIVMGKVTALAMRMKRILEGSRICVVDADNEYKLYNTIRSAGKNLKLVILDLDIEQTFALDLLKEARKRLEKTPIIIITPARKRNFFVEAMLQGATDFIIKPFLDETFLSKVYKYLSPENVQNYDIITLDLGRYIKGELRKAQKGRFAVSVIILSLAFENEGAESSENIAAAGYVFESLKDLFWETDIFIRFASKYYLGVFPFCDEKNTHIINQKIMNRFESVKNGNKLLKGYKLQTACVSYPYDTEDTLAIYDLLLQRIRTGLNDEEALQKQEPQKQEPQKQGLQKQEPQKQEPQKQEPQKQEPQKQEPQKQEPQKQEPQKQE